MDRWNTLAGDGVMYLIWFWTQLSGTVKQDDGVSLPQMAFSPRASVDHAYAPIMSGNNMRRSYDTATNRNNKFQQNARSGFKYWYEDKKPMPCKYFLVFYW